MRDRSRGEAADCVIAGQHLKEGERLWLSWAMANRDPAVFPNPNQVDLARQGNRHASFGLGIHRCIGSNMARMVFKRMLLAVPGLAETIAAMQRVIDEQGTAEPVTARKAAARLG